MRKPSDPGSDLSYPRPKFSIILKRCLEKTKSLSNARTVNI